MTAKVCRRRFTLRYEEAEDKENDILVFVEAVMDIGEWVNVVISKKY